MYQVRNADTNDLVTEADDRDEVLHLLDEECRRLHEAAAANPGAPPGTYRFDVVNAEGGAIAYLTYSPDTAHPYISVLVEDMPTEEQP